MAYGLELYRTFEVPDCSHIFDVKYHPTKPTSVFLCSIDGDVHIVDFQENGETINRLPAHHKGKPIRQLSFLDPQNLVTAGKSIKIFDLSSQQFSRQLSTKSTKVYSLKCVDENVIAAGDDGGTLHLFDLRAGDEAVMREKQFEEFVTDVDVDAQKRMLLATSSDGSLGAFNIRTKKFFMQSEPFDAGFQSVRFLTHRSKVVVGAEDGVINIFNLNEYGNISDRFPINDDRRGYVECGIDHVQVITDQYIVAGSADGMLRVVQLFPNRILHVTKPSGDPIDSLDLCQSQEQTVCSVSSTLYLHKFVSLEEVSQLQDEPMDSEEDSDSDSDSDDDNQNGKRQKRQKRVNKRPTTSNDAAKFFSDL